MLLKYMMQTYEPSARSSVIVIAQFWSQGHLLPRITTSIDIADEYERQVWMAAEIRDNNFAIGWFYRSDDEQQRNKFKAAVLFS